MLNLAWWPRLIFFWMSWNHQPKHLQSESAILLHHFSISSCPLQRLHPGGSPCGIFGASLREVVRIFRGRQPQHYFIPTWVSTYIFCHLGRLTPHFWQVFFCSNFLNLKQPGQSWSQKGHMSPMPVMRLVKGMGCDKMQWELFATVAIVALRWILVRLKARSSPCTWLFDNGTDNEKRVPAENWRFLLNLVRNMFKFHIVSKS